MRRITLLLLGLLLTGCASGAARTPAPASLRITGSTSLQPVLEDLAAAYQDAAPNVLIDIRGGGTAIGAQQLRTGQTDLAAVSWQTEGEELPDNLRAIPIARDGIAIIVHPSNRLTDLTALQLRALYRGEILDWDAVGGSNGVPEVVSREEGSGTRAGFEALAMGGERVTLNALVMPTSQAVVDYVASHSNAIGYVSSGALTDQVSAAPIEQVAPTETMVRAGAYRLSRTLYLYAPVPTSATAQAFLDFVLSPAGQTIVAKRLVAVR